MLIYETLFCLINKPERQTKVAHSCTTAVQFPSLESPHPRLRSSRLAAITGPVGGTASGILVEGNL